MRIVVVGPQPNQGASATSRVPPHGLFVLAMGGWVRATENLERNFARDGGGVE
jgi:hypothetical protein